MKVLPHEEYLKELSNTTLVCGAKSYFTDDVHDKYNRCGTDIVYRPWNTNAREKICMSCMLTEAKNGRQTEENNKGKPTGLEEGSSRPQPPD
jgi:hypothetical protein